MENMVKTPKRRGRIRWFIILGFVIVIAASLVYFKPWTRFLEESAAADEALADSSAVASADSTKKDDTSDGDKDKKKEVPIEMATVVRDSVSATYTASATLEAERDVDILAKIQGLVEKIHVEEGDYVQDGDILAILDGRELSIQVDKAVSSLNNATTEYERMQSLANRDLASQKALEDARHALQQAESILEEMKLKLSYTQIRAPFSGMVTQRFIETGQTINPGHQAFSIADMDPLLTRVYLPEDEIPNIKRGQPVQVRLDSEPDLQLSGRVRQIAPMVDRQTGTVKVTVEIEKCASPIRPGSFARVFITTDIHPLALVLPKRCLVEEAGKRYVFLIEGDTVVVRDVELGYEEADRIEIVEGLGEGDHVVLIGQGSLKDGSHVRVLNQLNEPEDAQVDTAEATS
ncbi:MAG: efflux RND transporter periplasmic adaptor subunit [Candidatus Eisenbacteria bacterium]|uniref:Efflux RND transporter periplasmic adaptor subunit n=1 Tax=Eiseniibacteriota bacterium TaxID=2212470 RepID=A0A948RZQ7_UNCEI|nr:efflux RND transporter periplasmic adaptor subunit [Candidatus Eisenbacteria bacterium]MBU1950585.1 efflux RND transporter periplasmic adaptor subunit [Candidatus Eisenbacteria bacterium]MBU2692612.1 efflux RND transporter periplasmic adaptor subunit [Candidatus Eisenbacteria bacterium]